LFNYHTLNKKGKIVNSVKHITLLGVFLLVAAYSCDWLSVRLHRFGVRGIDVSHYQSAIQWEEVFKQDIDFVFVKATEGNHLSDSLFARNWEAIQAHGIRRGAYHFFRASVPAEEQALNFIRNVPMEEGDLPPVLDVEVLDGLTKPEVLARMQTWLFMVEIAYGVKPIIYTNQKFYNTNLAGYFSSYPLWIARYNSRGPRLADGRKWTFWQHRDTGRLPGISGNVDFNVFRGSLVELETLCMKPKLAVSMR
jgi:lysozyme